MTGYLILALLLLGVWGVLASRHLIKKVIGLGVVNGAVITLFVWVGSLDGESAPILVKGVKKIVDPLPQALMLTAIVVGIGVTALSLALAYRIHRAYGTLDLREIEKKAQSDRD